MASLDSASDCAAQDLGHHLIAEIRQLVAHVHSQLDCLLQEGLELMDQAKLDLISNVQRQGCWTPSRSCAPTNFSLPMVAVGGNRCIPPPSPAA
jgi:hypothetical protein